MFFAALGITGEKNMIFSPVADRYSYLALLVHTYMVMA